MFTALLFAGRQLKYNEIINSDKNDPTSWKKVRSESENVDNKNQIIGTQELTSDHNFVLKKRDNNNDFINKIIDTYNSENVFSL